MTKTAKQILLLLSVMILGVAGIAVFFFMQKSTLEKEVVSLNQNLDKSETLLKQATVDKARMQGDLEKFIADNKNLDSENQNLQSQLEEAIAKARDIESQVDGLTRERDKWERRANTITEERDAFMAKVSELEAQGGPPKMSAQSTEETPRKQASSSSESIPGASSDDSYWAGILKTKASLEVQIEELKSDLSKQEIAVVDLKEENSNLKIEIDSLAHEKDEIGREIEHKESLINNLSLELARARNDKKFVADRVSKLNKENQDLRGKMKQLVSTKGALEKSIVRLSQDKNQIEQKLGQSETIIQSKIDEIWEIKDSIDETFKSTQMMPSSNEVELPPIVVNSNGASSHYTAGTSHGFNGRVVSINEENNFVIVDIGEGQGIHLGDTISVYRDSKYVARLEVIQVRKDISAADIKDQWSKIRVGDIIK